MSVETGGEVVATHIPAELVVEVLVRLPPKSLLRLRSLGKTWKNLIDSHAFIKRHLNEFKSTNEESHLVYYPGAYTPTPSIYCQLLSGQTKQVIELDQCPPCLDGRHLVGIHGRDCCETQLPKEEDNYFRTWIGGPANGVYCLLLQGIPSDGCTILLWNPGNRQVHVPPPLPPSQLPSLLEEGLRCNPHHEERKVVCGIGYDSSSSSSDLKIILASRYGYFYFSPATFFYLYSLSTNSWQQLDPFDIIPDPSMIDVRHHGGVNLASEFTNDFSFNKHPICFNGPTHWLIEDDEAIPWCILSFDFGCQAFKKICTPKHNVLFEESCSTLVVANGCLALVVYLETYPRCVASMFHVWVMREYNVQDSWTQAYKITLTQGPGLFVGIVDDEFFVREADENGKVYGRVFSYRLNAYEPIQGYCGYGIGDSYVKILSYRGSLVRIKP